MDLTKINKVSCLGEFLPTKKLSDLEEGKEYKITVIKSVKTKFGHGIVVTIEDEFTMFLPKRVVQELEDKDTFQKMKQASAENHLYLKYLGGPFKSNCEFLYK